MIYLATILCACRSCNKYHVYLPSGDAELVKYYTEKGCPGCGADLMVEKAYDMN